MTNTTTKTISCDRCEGTGEMRSGAVCHDCDGEAVVTVRVRDEQTEADVRFRADEDWFARRKDGEL